MKKRLILGIICIIIAGLIAGYVAFEWYKRKAAEDAFRELTKDIESGVVISPEPEPEPEKEEPSVYIPEKSLDWDAIREQNADIYAWVYVPDTNIDYPVLQHPEDDLYYLNHNMDGSVGYPGCIYSEREYNGTNFSDKNTVLYGHNMKNGTMFKTLHYFEDPEFFNQDRFIYIYTPENAYAYEIFAAFELDDRHILAGYDLSGEGALAAYEDILWQDGRGNFKTGETFTDEDRVLTLSTCANGGRDEVRYMIQGKRLN